MITFTSRTQEAAGPGIPIFLRRQTRTSFCSTASTEERGGGIRYVVSPTGLTPLFRFLLPPARQQITTCIHTEGSIKRSLDIGTMTAPKRPRLTHRPGHPEATEPT